MSTASAKPLALVLLALMASFWFLAALVTFIPDLAHDRVPKQFIPVCTWLTKPLHGGEPGEAMQSFIAVLARVSQILIGGAELIVGILLFGALRDPRQRLRRSGLGLAGAAALVSVFQLTMFAMHDKALPAWNQYPAMVAWIGVTWLVLALAFPAEATRDGTSA